MCIVDAESAFAGRKFELHRISVACVVIPSYSTSCSVHGLGHLSRFSSRIIISNNRK